MRTFAFVAALALSVPVIASAQSAGLLIGNQDYDGVPDVRRGRDIVSAATELGRAGMQVVELDRATAEQMRNGLVQFGQMSAQAEALLVGLSGRFVHSPTETYYLPADGQAGPLATLPQTALPLSTVFAWLSTKPGKAVLVLASDDWEAELGPVLSGGLGTLDVPQGVTVLIGSPRAAGDLVADYLAQPGQPFVGAARQAGFQVQGYAPQTLVLLEGSRQPQTTTDRTADIRDWRAARDANTAEAYRDYIRAHPRGEFVDMAENRLRTLTETPEAQAERTEQALDLNRDARRAIQRDLSLLDYDTRGIDGIFGPGTRRAISAWQRAQNFDETGFLDREQITLLDEQAARRAAELEAEAEARRRQQLERDLAYWEETGAKGDEAGLRAYLERFPDGEYAELAEDRLATIEERKRDQAQSLDRELWDEARALDTAQAYEDYLVQSPDGAFRREAQARIVELDRDSEFSEAARIENAMSLSPQSRRIVESRLSSMGLDPGPVDGVFDADTRRALRRYQASRNLPETGYLSDEVMVQLMADTVRQIFR